LKTGKRAEDLKIIPLKTVAYQSCMSPTPSTVPLPSGERVRGDHHGILDASQPNRKLTVGNVSLCHHAERMITD